MIFFCLTCTGRKVTGVIRELARPLRPARAHPAPCGGAQRLAPLLGHSRAPGVPISPRAARRPPEQGRCTKSQVQPPGAHRLATCAAARTGARAACHGAAKAGDSTLGAILRPRPAAPTRAASTQRGYAYLEPGARGPVAAAALRTEHWTAPGAALILHRDDRDEKNRNKWRDRAATNITDPNQPSREKRRDAARRDSACLLDTTVP